MGVIMAETAILTGDAIAVKLFEEDLIEEILKETVAGSMIAPGVLTQEDRLEQFAGDQITFQIRLNLTAPGSSETDAIDGNEEEINFNDDALILGQLSHAVKVASKISIGQQRVGFDLTMTGLNGLKKWFKSRFDMWFFNQITGNTSTAFTQDGVTFNSGNIILATGQNVATAPSTNRAVRAGAVASDDLLTSTDTMTLTQIDAMTEIAQTATPFIAPPTLNGMELYPMFIHTFQKTDLIRDTASPVTVVDIELNRLAGGADIEDTFLVKAQGFVYNDAMIIVNTRIPEGVDGSNVTVANTRCAVLCGEGAAHFGFKGGGDGEATFHRTFFDGGRRLQVAGHTTGGMTKVVFNSEDFGTVTNSTYAAQHTS